jgi:hypothetical protein
MKTIKRLGLRWLLPIVLAVVSASLFYYGAAQGRVAFSKTGESRLAFRRSLAPYP